MTGETSDILDDLFHGVAWHAFLEIWQESGQFPPDCETTRRRAFQLYEEALAEKNGRAIGSGNRGQSPATGDQPGQPEDARTMEGVTL
jgi:hypothetical protein